MRRVVRRLPGGPAFQQSPLPAVEGALPVGTLPADTRDPAAGIADSQPVQDLPVAPGASEGTNALIGFRQVLAEYSIIRSRVSGERYAAGRPRPRCRGAGKETCRLVSATGK
jgi:hypothetical protein